MMKKLINKELVALMLGVSKKTITHWQKRENDPLPLAQGGRAHLYDIAPVHEWGIRQRTKDLGVASDGKVYDYQAERARLTHTQANKADLELALMQGDVIPAEQVTEAWTEIVMNVRARLLAMPTRAAHLVHAAASTDEAREILANLSREILTELATDELSDEQRARIRSAQPGTKEIQSAA